MLKPAAFVPVRTTDPSLRTALPLPKNAMSVFVWQSTSAVRCSSSGSVAFATSEASAPSQHALLVVSVYDPAGRRRSSTTYPGRMGTVGLSLAGGLAKLIGPSIASHYGGRLRLPTKRPVLVALWITARRRRAPPWCLAFTRGPSRSRVAPPHRDSKPVGDQVRAPLSFAALDMTSIRSVFSGSRRQTTCSPRPLGQASVSGAPGGWWGPSEHSDAKQHTCGEAQDTRPLARRLRHRRVLCRTPGSRTDSAQ